MKLKTDGFICELKENNNLLISKDDIAVEFDTMDKDSITKMVAEHRGDRYITYRNIEFKRDVLGYILYFWDSNKRKEEKLKLLSKLYNEYNGSTYTYSELPENFMEAAKQYWEYECELSEKELNSKLYACLNVPTKLLVKYIMKCEDINDIYSTFDEYHKNYMETSEGINEYNKMWACILNNSEEEEIILDGWHRFHNYYSQGLKDVPCIFMLER